MKALPIALLVLSSAALGAGFARSAQEDEAGERLINRLCTTCHDVRRIQVQALGREEWSSKIQSMVEKGAEIPAADLPVMTDYLVRNHGPVPEGAGKAILLNTCTQCHDLRRVKEHGGTRRQWAETLVAMLNEGAPLSDEELPVILEYLTASFPPRQ